MPTENTGNAAAITSRKRLRGISPEAYRHPYDSQATATLRAVPGFELAARKFSRYSVERFLYVMACADACVKPTAPIAKASQVNNPVFISFPQAGPQPLNAAMQDASGVLAKRKRR